MHSDTDTDTDCNDGYRWSRYSFDIATALNHRHRRVIFHSGEVDGKISVFTVVERRERARAADGKFVCLPVKKIV